MANLFIFDLTKFKLEFSFKFYSCLFFLLLILNFSCTHQKIKSSNNENVDVSHPGGSTINKNTSIQSNPSSIYTQSSTSSFIKNVSSESMKQQQRQLKEKKLQSVIRRDIASSSSSNNFSVIVVNVSLQQQQQTTTDFFEPFVVVGRQKRVVALLSSTQAASQQANNILSSSSSSSSSSGNNNRQTKSLGATIINDGDIRESAYVCEDGQLELSCQHGKHIDVLRANFGRFSITLCNPSGFLDWSVNCASGNSILPILTERCASRSKCSIEASSSIFGDPCPGTSKYLEVHYRCSSEIGKINSNRNFNKSVAPKTSTSNNSGLLLPSDLYFMRKLSDNDEDSSSATKSIKLNNNNENFHHEDENGNNNQQQRNNKMNELISQENLIKTEMIPILLPVPTSFTIATTTTTNSKLLNHSSIHTDTETKTTNSLQQYYSPTSFQQKTGDDLYKHRNNNIIECEPGLIHQTEECNNNNKIDVDGASLKNKYDAPSTKGSSSNSQNGGQWLTEMLAEASSSSMTTSTTGVSATCEPIIYRDIQWPPTPSGSIAIRPCPHDTSGLAQWRCCSSNSIIISNGKSHFSSLKPPPVPPVSPITANIQHQHQYQHRASWIQLPDLSQCHSRWLLQLHSFQNVNNFRNDMWRSILINMQRSPFYGGDIIQLAGILENWSLRFFDGNRFQNFQNQLNGLDTIFEIISELLNSNHQPTWLDLPESKRETVALHLMDITIKYATILCLNKRLNIVVSSDSTSKEVIKQSSHLFVSCFPISKLIHEFQLNSNKNQFLKNSNTSEFRFELFSSTSSLTNNKVKVSMILNSANMEHLQKSQLLSENIYLSMLVPINLESYFQLSNVMVESASMSDSNSQTSRELNINNVPNDEDANSGGSPFLNLIHFESESLDHVDTFINGQVIKFIQFNDEQIVTQQRQTTSTSLGEIAPSSSSSSSSSSFNNHYAFEIIFKHLVDDNESLFYHQCVHWDESLNQWSNEHCILMDSNVTHSICRCRPNVLSVCTVLAIGQQRQSTYMTSNELPNDETSQLSTELTLAKHSGILSLTLIIYIWIALLLIRYRQSYFNQSNFVPLLLICIVRTLVEISSTLTINGLWSTTEWWMDKKWCHSRMFLIIFQLQMICSLFAVFLFQNVILLILANKIYLTKNYINSLQAIKRSRQIQILVSIIFPLIHLSLIYWMARNFYQNCWPQFDRIIASLFVTSPILQITLVITAGIIYLHCSQRVFEYDYPTNMQCLQTKDTSSMEKHIKELFFSRCKHSVIWIMVTMIYLISVVGCLCCSLLYNHTSYAMIGIDIAISLTFVLFARVKYLFNLIVKCGGHRSSTKNTDHCYNHSASNIGIGQLESASSSIDSKHTRDNSISILSDTSKTFLTLPSGGQMSLSSPKIYPAHQSSCIYGNGFNIVGTNSNSGHNNSNPSSHLYESPSHLYNYEYERRFHHSNNKNGGNSSSTMHNVYNTSATGRHHRPFYALDGMVGPQPSSIQLHSAIRDSNTSLNRIRPHLTATSHLQQQQQPQHGTTRAYSFDRPIFS